MNAQLMKIYLANDMADWRMDNDPNEQDRDFWIEYYLEMRDFDLLEIWMENHGHKLINTLNSVNYN